MKGVLGADGTADMRWCTINQLQLHEGSRRKHSPCCHHAEQYSAHAPAFVLRQGMNEIRVEEYDAAGTF